jgi:hypothetical protein
VPSGLHARPLNNNNRVAAGARARQIYGVVWNPYYGDAEASKYEFVSFGVKHINFWNYDPAARALTSKGGIFGDTTQQNVYHACFLRTEPSLVTGGANGKIAWWSGNAAQVASARLRRRPPVPARYAT